MNPYNRQYGFDVGGSAYAPRGIVAAPERTLTGNIVLRAGNELPEGGWTQSVYVVLSPAEAVEFIAALQAQVDAS